MPEDEDEEQGRPNKAGGCVFRLVRTVLVMGLIAALAMFAWQVLSPQDLTDVESAAGRDLPHLLEQAQAEGGEVSITEAELNGFIAGTLGMGQAGLLGETVAVRRVLVRLEPGIAEVIIEREVFGYPQTVSMFLRIVQDPQDERSIEVSLDAGELIKGLSIPVGGRFGQLRIPQGFLRLVLGSFVELTKVYAPELRLLGLDGGVQGTGPLPQIGIGEKRLRVAYPRR